MHSDTSSKRSASWTKAPFRLRILLIPAIFKGLNAKKIQEEEIPNFYSYGDSSSFYVLKKKQMPVGNYFTVREGTKNYILLMTGMYFDDPEVWKELIEPKLKQFSVYKPA